MQQHQLSLQLIRRNVNGGVIEQRAGDGYVNATQLCHIADKRWYNYVRLETTGKFLRALETKTHIRVSEQIQEVRDGHGTVSTWVHPKVAIHLAQWLSADFAVQVSEWVFEWMSGGSPGGRGAPVLPYHLKRHMDNMSRVPADSFSILQEMSMTLLGPLESHGYTLPERFVPDISQGRLFCDFLRKHGYQPDFFPTYKHLYPDGREVDAKLYPLHLLGQFRQYIAEVWMPTRAAAYFKQRDPLALPYLDKVLLLSAPRQRAPTSAAAALR
jgi:hypothetical protein